MSKAASPITFGNDVITAITDEAQAIDSGANAAGLLVGLQRHLALPMH